MDALGSRPGDASDEELLVGLREDPAAIAELYRRHEAGLRRAMRSRLRDASTADDLAAETWAQALLSHRRYVDRGPGSARAWLSGIATNQFRRYCERRSVETRALARLGLETPELADPMDAIDDKLLAQEVLAGLDCVLAELPPAHRATLQLRFAEDLSYEEIAARRRCTPATSRQHLSRALRSLRAQIDGDQS